MVAPLGPAEASLVNVLLCLESCCCQAARAAGTGLGSAGQDEQGWGCGSHPAPSGRETEAGA